MTSLFIRARVRNMWTEFMRLNGFMFSREHNRCNFRTADYRSLEKGGSIIGCQYKYVTTSDGRIMRDSSGEYLEVRRDALDMLIDFVGNWVGTYVNNVFKVEMCNHPHDQVYEDWDGDSDYGYVMQRRCYKCHGYLSDDPNEIDRYTTERNPDGIHRAGARPVY